MFKGRLLFNVFLFIPVNTRRYLDVDSTSFGRYGRQNYVVCLLSVEQRHRIDVVSTALNVKMTLYRY